MNEPALELPVSTFHNKRVIGHCTRHVLQTFGFST